MDRWRELYKLLSCGEKMMTSTWPCWIIEQHHCQTLTFSQQLLMDRRLRNKLPMMESLLQPASNNQQEISRYLEKTQESQKKHHDRHVSKKLKELQPGTKVALDKFQSLEASHCSQASPYTKILWRRLKTAESIAATGDIYEYALHQDKEPVMYAEPDQLTTPIMLPEIPSQEQPMHPELAVENITEPCRPNWQTSSSTKPA